MDQSLTVEEGTTSLTASQETSYQQFRETQIQSLLIAFSRLIFERRTGRDVAQFNAFKALSDQLLWKEIRMTLHTAQQLKVISLTEAHAQFNQAISGMFSWFQTAVAGYKAELDFDTEFDKFNALVASDDSISERLKNEWSSYARALRAAYNDFGRDVVTKMGFDEPAQVRNLALSIAGGSFTRARQASRDVLVSGIEGML